MVAGKVAKIVKYVDNKNLTYDELDRLISELEDLRAVEEKKEEELELLSNI